MSEALRALEERLGLIRYFRSSAGQEIIEAVDESQPPLFLHTLERASTYWVSPSMCHLIRNAAKSMPDQPLNVADPPSPYGFVRLASPWTGIDCFYRDESPELAALAWATAYAEHPDGGLRGVLRMWWFSTWATAAARFKARGIPWPEALSHPPLFNMGPSDWFIGEGFAQFTGRRAVEGAITDQERLSREEDRRITAALWTIMSQRLPRSSPEMPPRALSRRMARLDVEVSGVRVVTLRRYGSATSDPDESSSVDWSHRWIVGGHWRNQYLPSTGGHRLQFIHPYVKGPEDKPLVVKDTVGSLVR